MQTIENEDLMGVVRGKINSNFSSAQITGNIVQVITVTPSTTKYPSEKAVSDYASKIYSSSTIPTSKSGDLFFHQNASQATSGLVGTKGKLKFNSGGTLQEIVPDRSVVDYRTSSALASATLLAGELAIESDTGKMKIGNGSAAYSGLPYLSASSSEPGDIGITYGGSAAAGEDIQYQQGWIKMPNGMIMQWGLNVYSANGLANFDQVITLPVSFNKKRIYSHGILETGRDWNDSQVLVHPRGLGLTSLEFVVEGGLSPSNPYELHWMAIGF